MEYKIYGLHSGDRNIRYIGTTRGDLKARLRGHMGDINRNRNPHKCSWLKKHKERVQIVLLEAGISNEVDAGYIEAFHIRAMSGSDLLNKTPGGAIVPFEKQYKGSPWNKGRKCHWKSKLIANSPRARKVYQYDLDGGFVGEWRSVKCASIETGCPRAGIKNVADRKDRYLQSKGYQWRWFKAENIGPVVYNEDERIRMVRSGKWAKQKKVRVKDHSNGAEHLFENAQIAAKFVGIDANSVRVYCGNNLVRRFKEYSYA